MDFKDLNRTRPDRVEKLRKQIQAENLASPGYRDVMRILNVSAPQAYHYLAALKNKNEEKNESARG